MRTTTARCILKLDKATGLGVHRRYPRHAPGPRPRRVPLHPLRERRCCHRRCTTSRPRHDVQGRAGRPAARRRQERHHSAAATLRSRGAVPGLREISSTTCGDTTSPPKTAAPASRTWSESRCRPNGGHRRRPVPRRLGRSFASFTAARGTPLHRGMRRAQAREVGAQGRPGGGAGRGARRLPPLQVSSTTRVPRSRWPTSIP